MRTPKSSPSPATDDGGEEEEERRAQIDGTLDEVVDASSSVVAGSRIPRLRRRQLVSGGNLTDGSAPNALRVDALRPESTTSRRHATDAAESMPCRRCILIDTLPTSHLVDVASRWRRISLMLHLVGAASH